MWWYIYVFIGLIAKKNGLIACVAYALHLQFESVLFLREGCACTCVCARVPVGIYFRKAPEVSQGVIPCYSLHMFAKKKWDGSLGCSKGSKRPEVWSENYGASDSDPEVWP